MRYSNLHTHSIFSDGKHSLEENVRSAIEKGMCSLGFSDHSFTPCDTSYCMDLTRYASYMKEIDRLKEEYGEQIELFTGMELDAYSACDRTRFDYIIASVHYLIRDGVCHPIDHSAQQQKDCMAQAFDGDVLAMAQAYFDLLAEHVEAVKPTFVGHFDVITKFSLMPEADARYQQIAGKALERVLKTCPYIEMNTGAISRGVRQVPYPSVQLLEIIRDNGGEIVLGSDSHHRDNLIFGFDNCVATLKSLGFDHISMFRKGGYRQEAI